MPAPAEREHYQPFENDLPKAEVRLTFDPNLSIRRSLQLKAEKAHLSPEAYQQKEDAFRLALWEELGRALDERNNRIGHEITYDLVDGILMPPDHSKPMTVMIRDGIAYRENMVGVADDRLREQAELLEFVQLEQWANNASDGDVFVVCSPPGKRVTQRGLEPDPAIDSAYDHNFVDCSQLTITESGQRQIHTWRLNSALTPEEHFALYRRLNPDLPKPLHLSPAYFISNGQEMPSDMTIDELAAIIQKGATGRSGEECDYAKSAVRPAGAAFIEAVIENPYNQEAIFQKCKATFKANDMVLKAIDQNVTKSKEPFGEKIVTDRYINIFDRLASYDEDDVRFLSAQQLDTLSTACGFSMDPSQPYGAQYAQEMLAYYDSTATLAGFMTRQAMIERWMQDEGFGVDDYGSQKITCEDCGQCYSRPYNVRIPGCTLVKQDGPRKGQVCGYKPGIAC